MTRPGEPSDRLELETGQNCIHPTRHERDTVVMGGTSNASSVKRILRELRELATTSNPDIAAVACEDELF